MIGNDIVDLSNPMHQEHFCNENYLLKMLHPDEFHILETSDRLIIPALFWTCKESAYKAVLKKNINCSFSPSRFCVIPDSGLLKGIVLYENFVIYYSSEINEKYIHTVSTSKKNIEYSTEIIEDISKESYYKNLLERFAVLFSECDKISIQKNSDGIPFLYNGNNKVPVDISFSHDRMFHSFTCFYL